MAKANTSSSFPQELIKQYQHILDQQEEELQSAENIFQSIIQYHEDIILSMPGNVYWLDKNCRTMGCSKDVLDMFGLTSVAEFKGLSFSDMGKIGGWNAETTEIFERDSREVIKTGQPKLNIEEPPIPHSDGRTIHFLTSRVPLFDRSNNVIGVAGVSIDISELKNTQIALKKEKEKAEAASSAKSEFLANMSHDVKTPLSGIIGLSELLAHRLKDQDNLVFAKTLFNSGQQLLHFFDNCLEVFKLETHNLTLSNECFDLKKLLEEIEELYYPAVKTKGLAFSIHYDEQTPSHVIGSRIGIYRVLLNLVGNAVKFTHKGFIKLHILPVHAAKQLLTLKIIVEDSGIGIPFDKQKIIFDRFSRLIPSYKGTYEGSGIGLYIVNKFVKSMHGDIHVESMEGKGSRFSIILPFSLPNETEIQAIETKKHTIHNFQNLQHFAATSLPQTQTIAKTNTLTSSDSVKILIVEDNLTAQLIQRSLLTSINCHIEIADSGEAALEMFEPGKYDLIFMDIGLPGLQGDATAKIIRKIEQYSGYHVPIIALTAHTAENHDKKYLAAGMEMVLNKPLSREQAKKIIEQYSIQAVK